MKVCQLALQLPAADQLRTADTALLGGPILDTAILDSR